MEDRKEIDVTNLDQSHACLLRERYSLEYLLMNCMTIWKMKDCYLRKQKSAEEN